MNARDVLGGATAILGFVFAIGCPKAGDSVGANPTPKPTTSAPGSVDVASSAAPSTSASVSVAPSSEASAAASASETPPEPDELGCPSNHGWGDGIGLGTVGGFGGNISGKPKATPMVAPIRGLVVSTSGIDAPKSSAVICDALTEYRLCSGEAHKADAKVTGKLDLEIHVTTSGKVEKTVKLATSTLANAPLIKCLEKAVSALAFAPPKAPATIVYQFDVPPKLKSVKMIDGGATVKGALPPEVVKRIVRANFPRFRQCYEQTLKKTPTLAGKVVVEFVVDSTGAVESAKLAGGTLTDTAMTGCVVGVYQTLSFPEPEKGKVTVTYPIEFRDEE